MAGPREHAQLDGIRDLVAVALGPITIGTYLHGSAERIGSSGTPLAVTSRPLGRPST